MIMNLVKKFISFIVAAASFLIILKILIGYFNQYGFRLDSFWQVSLIPAVLFFLGYFYLRALSWHTLMKSLGEDVSPKENFAVWFLSEFTRYIPGNVWSFGSRIVLAGDQGVAKKVTAAALSLEIILLIVTTAVLSVPALTMATKLQNWNLLIIIPAFSAGVLAVFLVGKKTLEKRIKALSQITLQKPLLGIAALYQSVAWICFGLGTFSLLSARMADPLVIVSAVILSWLVGYLSLITPMGLGVREGALIFLVGPLLGVGAAAWLAVFSRLIIILVELINVLLWMVFKQRQKAKILAGKLLSRWQWLVLGLMIIAYTAVFGYFTILRHDAFASNYDLANMDQTIWNTLHGHFFTLSGTNGPISRLSIHADFMLILLSPLYLLWDNVRVLLIASSFFLALGVIPTYLLSYKLLKSKIVALAMAAVYLLNPGMEWTNMYDFHAVSLAIPLLLFAFYAAYIKKWRWFFLFAVLALVTKEEISLFIAMLGLAIAFIFRERKIGLATFVIGCLWFVTMVFVIIPYFSPTGGHWAWGWYQLSDDGGNLIIDWSTFDIISHKFVLAQTANDYYASLLKPFGFLPLLGLPWLLLSLPELTINVLSSQDQMRSITFHYDSGITPALVIGTIFALYYLKKFLERFNLARFSSPALYLAVSLLLAAAFRVNHNYSPLPTTPSCWCLSYRVTANDQWFDEVLQNIPPGASVAASGNVRPHITHRINAYVLPNEATTADYVAILTQERIVGGYNQLYFETNLVQQLLKDPQYHLQSHVGQFYLFKKF